MEIEVVSERNNPLLRRVELRIRVEHKGKKTPTRDEVREAIAKIKKVQKDRVIVDYLHSEFGWGVSRGYVKIYDTKKDALEIEEEHILIRNGLIEKKEG
ncbi:MAG: 30S ribosomal protein S24e [Thermoplasmata archaeon]|nr:MAG: 30S ribosomal protein S24e [Thermoplasmata archaeon]